MSAVNVKLSRQDAKYLVGLLDAVVQATKVMDKREPQPARYHKMDMQQAIRTVLHEVGEALHPKIQSADIAFLSGLDVAQDIEKAIVPTLTPISPEMQEQVRRAQALQNTLPMGHLPSAHALALRLGAAIQTASNIADEHAA